MSTISEVKARARWAQINLDLVTYGFSTWYAEELLPMLREMVLDYYDEPQVQEMIDDGCPNL